MAEIHQKMVTTLKKKKENQGYRRDEGLQIKRHFVCFSGDST